MAALASAADTSSAHLTASTAKPISHRSPSAWSTALISAPSEDPFTRSLHTTVAFDGLHNLRFCESQDQELIHQLTLPFVVSLFSTFRMRTDLRSRTVRHVFKEVATSQVGPQHLVLSISIAGKKKMCPLLFPSFGLRSRSEG